MRSDKWIVDCIEIDDAIDNHRKFLVHIRLNRDEVAAFLDRNLQGVASDLPKTIVNSSKLPQFFATGNLLVLVDGKHWVQVRVPVTGGSGLWVKVYGSEVGVYEQLLGTFQARCGTRNYFVAVNPM